MFFSKQKQKLYLQKAYTLNVICIANIFRKTSVNSVLKNRLAIGEFYHLHTDLRNNETLFHAHTRMNIYCAFKESCGLYGRKTGHTGRPVWTRKIISRFCFIF